MLKKLAKTLTKSHKFSGLKAEWKAEGSSELAVSPASLFMHIFDRQTPVSTVVILCLTICLVQEERTVHGCPTICRAQGTMSY